MKNFKRFFIVSLLVLTTTGCTSYLKDENKKTITNPSTGQSLTDNILCRPQDEETIELYEKYGVDISSLPYCSCKNVKATETVTDEEGNETTKEVECTEYTVTSGGYEGLWTSIFVKPLAWVILFFGKTTNSFGLGLIITSVLIRLIAIPLTSKSLKQTEAMKKLQPEMDRLEKKYASKDQNDKEVMMMKSQEMMALYKKYDVNPISGCLFSFIQLPLFMAFLEAINRVPAIFEEKFLLWHLGTSPSVGIQNGNYWYIIIVLLVAVTTFLSFRNSNSNQGNSEQAKQTKTMMNGFLIMIIIMSVFMSTALGIYWVISNLFSLVQNLIVKRSIK